MHTITCFTLFALCSFLMCFLRCHTNAKAPAPAEEARVCQAAIARVQAGRFPARERTITIKRKIANCWVWIFGVCSSWSVRWATAAAARASRAALRAFVATETCTREYSLLYMTDDKCWFTRYEFVETLVLRNLSWSNEYSFVCFAKLVLALLRRDKILAGEAVKRWRWTLHTWATSGELLECRSRRGPATLCQTQYTTAVPTMHWSVTTAKMAHDASW